MKKTLKELTIKDNFMFSAVMVEEANCRGLLEFVTGVPIERVTVTREKSFVYHPEYKGVRLDIYASDEKNTRYNVEMQMLSKPALNKRARYYRSQMDMDLLAGGWEYEELPETYIIFICDFDPFGKGYYRYRFVNQCLEDDGLQLKDGTHTIFLNTCGKKEQDVPKELIDFLHYVGSDLKASEQDFCNDYIRQLQRAVKNVKQSREMEERFMTLEEMLREERKESFEKGVAQGKVEGIAQGLISSILCVLEQKGNVPQALQEHIERESDLQVMRRWLVLSAKVETLRQFEEQMEE